MRILITPLAWLENHGVADLLVALDMGEHPDLNKHLIPVDDKGNLFLIPAGNISAAYANTLTLLDPGAWYSESENPLKKLMSKVAVTVGKNKSNILDSLSFSADTQWDSPPPLLTSGKMPVCLMHGIF